MQIIFIKFNNNGSNGTEIGLYRYFLKIVRLNLQKVANIQQKSGRGRLTQSNTQGIRNNRLGIGNFQKSIRNQWGVQRGLKNRSLKFQRFRKRPSGLGRYRWFRCKKPYWRRKSYKYVKFYSYLISNYYKFSRNSPLVNLKQRRSKFTSSKAHRWSDYYRRRKAKAWFKQKILFRSGWMDRYHHWTHRKLYNTTVKFRKKYAVLKKFLQQYEFTLDRYIFVWDIKPKIIKSIYQCRQFINAGFIRVNFHIITSFRYIVKTGDCIFCFKSHLQKINYYFILRMMNPYKAKYRRGYRLKEFFKLRKLKRYKKKTSSKYKKAFLFLRKYKLLNYLNSNHSPYFNAYYYYFERSFKYKIFINLEAISWFIYLFSTFFSPTQVHVKISDLFINRRYYG